MCSNERQNSKVLQSHQNNSISYGDECLRREGWNNNEVHIWILIQRHLGFLFQNEYQEVLDFT